MEDSCIYSNFGKDLLYLYSSIGHKDLENVFCKFAQDYNANFFAWLRKNKSLKNYLNNPNVYLALIALDDLRREFGAVTSPSEAGKLINVLSVSPKYLRYSPYYKAFSSLISDSTIAFMIAPYIDLIQTIDKFIHLPSRPVGGGAGAMMPNASDVVNDLLVIKKQYEDYVEKQMQKTVPKKQDKKTQQKEMFKYLLRSFSEEMSSAAQLEGYSQLAQSFKNYSLAKPVKAELEQYVEFAPVSSSQIDKVAKVVMSVLERYDAKYGNYNHNLIEITLLHEAGGITEKDVSKIKETFDKERNIKDLMGEGEEDYPSIDTGDMITTNIKLHPTYIYLLSSFFLMYQIKLGYPIGLSI